MKKSVFRKVLLFILIINFILLVMISNRLEVFAGIEASVIFNVIVSILNNSYVCSFLCSILAVISIYFFQVRYSKRMLKKDFRCNEIINGVYDGIDGYCDLADKIPERDLSGTNECADDVFAKYGLIYYQFYESNKSDIDLIILALSYEGNDLLIESVQSCFFINLNFKLLSIVNHIKNRLPNLREKQPEIISTYEKYKSEKKESDLKSLGLSLHDLFIDLRFMATYWKALFDYLEYDHTHIRMFLEIYKSKYKNEDDIKQPINVLEMRAREIEKEVKKAMWLYKLKHIWNK